MADDINDDLENLDRTPITVERWILNAVLDVATQSMDFGSGFLCDAEVEALRAAAEVLGIDPVIVTPSNFVCKYGGEHQWSYKRWGTGPASAEWYCQQCRHTSHEKPPEVPDGVAQWAYETVNGEREEMERWRELNPGWRRLTWSTSMTEKIGEPPPVSASVSITSMMRQADDSA